MNNNDNLIAQTKILTSQIADLLGIYFVCEKIAKRLTKAKKGDLKLNELKKVIKDKEIIIDESDINLIFNTSWKIKGKKSFRHIRNYICHECSIAERDYAVEHAEEYLKVMNKFINSYLERNKKRKN